MSTEAPELPEAGEMGSCLSSDTSSEEGCAQTTDLLPFVPVAEPDFGEIEEKYLMEAWRSGFISSLGKFVTRFELDFATFCNTKFAVSCSNGTVAITLLLRALNIGEGDEVVVPSFTYVATAAAVFHAGAKPVFADCEDVYGTICVDSVRNVISSKTKAVMAVHVYGHPADMDPLAALCREHGIYLLEDAAEAHSALYKGRKAGSLGDGATFSFFGNKVLTTGEGGMITLDSVEVDKRCRFLRNHAMSTDPDRRYWHTEVGYNYRMPNLQAAVGVGQLQRSQDIISRKRSVFGWYKEEAEKLNLQKDYGLQFNPCRNDSVPAPWLVTCLLPADYCPTEDVRNAVLRDLRTRSVDSRPFFYPVHTMPPYVECRAASASAEVFAPEAGKPCTLPVTESLARRSFNLPSGAKLDRETVVRVVSTLRDVLMDHLVPLDELRSKASA